MAEKTRQLLIRQNLFDNTRLIMRDDTSVFIPVRAPPEGEFEVVEIELPPSKSLKEPVLRASFDIVGSLAIINDMDLPLDRAEEIARDILRRHPRVKTVLQKTGEVAGEERVATYSILLGEKTTETTHRESGCLFKVDVGKAFFSPRLSGERLRVTSCVKEGEKILDMFAGVGPFSIIIASKHPATIVYAVEKNPTAYRYLCENIALNKLVDRVKPFLGDAAQIVPILDTYFDRIIMDLPRSSIKYLDTAMEKATSNSTIHIYVLEERNKPSEHRQLIKKYGEIMFERVVKEVSPKAVIRVYDLKTSNL